MKIFRGLRFKPDTEIGLFGIFEMTSNYKLHCNATTHAGMAASASNKLNHFNFTLNRHMYVIFVRF